MWTKRALRQNSPLPAHCISIQSLQETLGELRDISADADRGSEEPKQGTKKYRAFLRSWEEPEIVGRSGDQKFFKLTDDRFTHLSYDEDFGGHLRWFCEACQEEILSQKYKDDTLLLGSMYIWSLLNQLNRS